jgi:hypothetical protein
MTIAGKTGAAMANAAIAQRVKKCLVMSILSRRVANSRRILIQPLHGLVDGRFRDFQFGGGHPGRPGVG